MNLSHAFAGQNVGVTQVGERIWLVTFTEWTHGNWLAALDDFRNLLINSAA